MNVEERYIEVRRPSGVFRVHAKVYGAWALHRALRDDMPAPGDLWTISHAPMGVQMTCLRPRAEAERAWWRLAMERAWWPWHEGEYTQRELAELCEWLAKVISLDPRAVGK